MSFSVLFASHIFQPVMDALEYVAVHLKAEEQRSEFLLRVLQSFVQQGIEGKRASDRYEQYTMKSSSSSFSLGLLLPVLATVRICTYAVRCRWQWPLEQSIGTIAPNHSVWFLDVAWLATIQCTSSSMLLLCCGATCTQAKCLFVFTKANVKPFSCSLLRIWKELHSPHLVSSNFLVTSGCTVFLWDFVGLKRVTISFSFFCLCILLTFQYVFLLLPLSSFFFIRCVSSQLVCSCGNYCCNLSAAYLHWSREVSWQRTGT